MSKICPSLADLPPPPKGKVGWPWTEESPRSGKVMEDGSDWPLISIVTPSYNQAEYLEETIRSILLQGYPNLEYFIFDGGSSDNSNAIIKKYDKWIDFWVSEPDRGQSHAINKGWERANGEILAWLNSDDFYQKSALSKAAEASSKTPVGITYGHCEVVNLQSKKVSRYVAPQPSLRFFHRLWSGWKGEYNISQPSTFFDRELLARTGHLKEYYNYAMDYDLILRASVRGNFNFIDETLASFRKYPENKSSQPGLCGLDMYKTLLQDHRKTVSHIWGDNHLIIAKKYLADTMLDRLRYENSVNFSKKMKVTLEAISIDPLCIFRNSFWRMLALSCFNNSQFLQLKKNLGFN